MFVKLRVSCFKIIYGVLKFDAGSCNAQDCSDGDDASCCEMGVQAEGRLFGSVRGCGQCLEADPHQQRPAAAAPMRTPEPCGFRVASEAVVSRLFASPGDQVFSSCGELTFCQP